MIKNIFKVNLSHSRAELPGLTHLAGGAQATCGRRLGEEAETLQVRLQVSAELHLHRLHSLVHWVHGFSYWPVREKKRKEKKNDPSLLLLLSFHIEATSDYLIT